MLFIEIIKGDEDKLKMRSYYFFILILLMTLVGCGNKEDTSKNNVTPATKEAETTNNQEQESTEEETNFQILETIEVFGGNTFNIDGTIDEVHEVYVSEQDNNVFVSFNGNRAVTGNEDGWKSISDRFDKDFVRGEMIYKEEDGKLLTNKFTFDDAKVLEKIGEAITAEYFYSTDTSQGEGVVIETGEQSYTLYVDNQPVLEFQDNKEILERSRGEQQMYVDIEKKRLFFAQSYGDYGTVNGIDLDSGNPLFIDGKLKELETTRSVDIIGDGEGTLFVVEYGDFEGLIRISAFDSDLDLLVGPFDVPVRDSDEVAVTITKDEVHIWAYHRYEMEPALELVKISRPTLN